MVVLIFVWLLTTNVKADTVVAPIIAAPGSPYAPSGFDICGGILNIGEFLHDDVASYHMLQWCGDASLFTPWLDNGWFEWANCAGAPWPVCGAWWPAVVKKWHSCPPGFQFHEAGGGQPSRCISTADDGPPKNAGPCCSPGGPLFVGNPINAGTGNKYQIETDYSAAGSFPLTFQRHYNSVQGIALARVGNRWLPSARLGNRWRSTYDRAITLQGGTASDLATAYVDRPDGRTRFFNYTAGGVAVPLTYAAGGAVWTPDADIDDRLVRNADGSGNTIGWLYIVANDDSTESYGASGDLLSITDRAGRTQTLTYSDATISVSIAPGAGYPIVVTDYVGRQMHFTYDARGRQNSLTDIAGRLFQFSYDAAGNLVYVAFPDGTTRSYVYNEAANTSGTNLPAALTGIVDQNRARFVTFKYDTLGRAYSSEHGGGVDRYTIDFAHNQVTDPLLVTRSYSFTPILGVTKGAGVSQPCNTCDNGSNFVTYDSSGNVSSRTDFNDKKTCYAYDLSRNLETARIEGALSSEDCATVLASPPNRPDVRRIITTWHASYRLPATMVEPAPGGTKATTFAYDPSGNLTQKSIVAPANDGTGNTVTRSWNWTYATLGRVLIATDPDGHTTATSYYADNDPDLGKRGNVASITNAAGHVTQITAYDANSRPLSITDPNGLVTTLTYHPRGWLTSRQVGNELTIYDYDGVGQLIKVTQPEGSYLQYTYDAAHRLTQINDSLNNKIVYTLDAMGNRIQEQTFDPSNTLSRTRQQVLDSLNRLHQSVGAQ